MAKYITIISGKGGVGKTATAINLAAALKKFGKNVILVDANLVTPNVSLQLGLSSTPVNLNAVLKNKATLEEAVCHHESGLKVIPASLSIFDSLNHEGVDFKEVLAPLAERVDYVIMDCGAGLWGNISKAVSASDEVIVVTNPELPALIDSLKSIKMAERLGATVRGVVINKVTNEGHEPADEVVSGIFNGYNILAKVPFDKNISKSISARKPLVHYKPRSHASKAYNRLTADLIGEEYKEPLFHKVLDIFGF